MKHISWLFLLTAAIVFPPAIRAVEKPVPEPGPEHDGLRLRLTVEPVAGAVDENNFRLEILNVTKEPVTLVANNVHEVFFKDYIIKSVTFSSFPEAPTDGFKILVGSQANNLECNIEPGEPLKAEWTVKGRSISSFWAQTTISFPTTGRFALRALLTVTTKAGKRIALWSNTHPLLVGGSEKAPKAYVGKVGWTDEKTQSVFLFGLTSDKGYVVGDLYRIDLSMRGSYLLKIEEVSEQYSKASVLKLEDFHYDHIALPPLPEKGLEVSLVPESENNVNP